MPEEAGTLFHVFPLAGRRWVGGGAEADQLWPDRTVGALALLKVGDAGDAGPGASKELCMLKDPGLH